jgi:alpha-tubulin suppressor-like RCC1 family protein
MRAAAGRNGDVLGSNAYGQLGSSGVGSDAVTVAGLSEVVSIATGYFHTCAAKTDRSVLCWGRNDTCAFRRGNVAACWGSNSVGQLGAGSDAGMSASPLPVIKL